MSLRSYASAALIGLAGVGFFGCGEKKAPERAIYASSPAYISLGGLLGQVYDLNEDSHVEYIAYMGYSHDMKYASATLPNKYWTGQIRSPRIMTPRQQALADEILRLQQEFSFVSDSLAYAEAETSATK